MATEMVERLARALYAREKARSDHADAILSTVKGAPVKVGMEPWEECAEIFIGDATAALQALMEPTDEMLEAALTTSTRFGKPAMRNIFRTMISSAIGGG